MDWITWFSGCTKIDKMWVGALLQPLCKMPFAMRTVSGVTPFLITTASIRARSEDKERPPAQTHEHRPPLRLKKKKNQWTLFLWPPRQNCVISRSLLCVYCVHFGHSALLPYISTQWLLLDTHSVTRPPLTVAFVTNRAQWRNVIKYCMLYNAKAA